MTINLSTLLDVAIGLIFIFFVFSIFVSGIVELINTLLEQRAKLLQIALGKILDADIFKKFFDHELTQVKEEKFFGFLKPINYLSADSFSTVLTDILVGATGPAPEGVEPTKYTFEKLKQILLETDPKFDKIKALIRPILIKSDNFQTFKTELEKWYNGYMEQVSGWFKRYAQGVIWIVAVLIALILNVDTIYLTDRLFNDNGFRDRLVAEAIKTTQNGGKSLEKDTEFSSYVHDRVDPKLVDSTSGPKGNSIYKLKADLTDSEKLIVQATYVQFVQKHIAELKLPIGWEWTQRDLKLQSNQNGWLVLPGWILTAAALSFGAPFWFDLLLKLVNIRNTARRPPGNPDPAT